MRRVIAMLLVVCFTLCLCACGKDEVPDKETSSSRETEKETVKKPLGDEVTEVPEETEEATEEATEETTEETTEAPEQQELVDGMRPEFKKAMDDYEAFYDEYCDFMKKYQENPSDMSLLTEYTQMLEKLQEMEVSFAAWDEDELNDAELKYYLDVTNRVAKKLVDVLG